jgi:hypothetical protein
VSFPQAKRHLLQRIPACPVRNLVNAKNGRQVETSEYLAKKMTHNKGGCLNNKWEIGVPSHIATTLHMTWSTRARALRLLWKEEAKVKKHSALS